MSTNPKIFIKRLIKKLNYKDLIIEQQKSFIQQQDKMLELACVVLTENGIGCPASIDTIEWPECDDKCDVDDIQECTCWRKYLQGEVSK